jgi:hypothetical protein
VKATRPQLDKALKAPASTRLFLLHGADEAGNQALARRVGAALGPEAERISLSGAELKGDPARLADEAASLSMFGSGRWVLVSPAGDEATEAVAALLSAPAAGNPVVLIAGALKPTSKLLKLALGDPRDRLCQLPAGCAGFRPPGRGAGARQGAGGAAGRCAAHRRGRGSEPRRAEQELEKIALTSTRPRGAASRRS